MDWADELAASVSGAAGRQRQQDAVGHRPCRQPPRPGHPRRDRPRPPRPAASRRRSSTGSTTWTRWTPRRSSPPTRSSTRWAGRWPTSPTRPATATRRTPRHHAQVFIDTFAGLGIQPDRYYWMSEIYPTGAMDPYIRTALDRADRGPRDLSPGGQRPAPRRVAPAPGGLRGCGKVGTTIVTRLGRRAGPLRVPARPRDLGPRLRARRLDLARSAGRGKLRWNLEWAAQWSLFGVTIEPCGKDLATAGGSRDRSDAIAREVFEREPPLNVPYEFLNIGGRKMSTSKGRGAAAHRIVEVVPPEQLRLLFLRPRPQSARSSSTRRGPTRSRACSTSSTSSPPRPPAARSGASCRRRRSGLRATPRWPPTPAVAAEAAAYRPPFAHLALLAQVPAWTGPARSRAEKGQPLDRSRSARSLDERARRRPGLARGLRARTRPRRRPVADALPAVVGRARRRSSGASSARSPTPRDRAAASRAATPGRTLIFAVAAASGTACRGPAALRGASTWPSSVGPTARARAGSWPASTAGFVVGRLREAAARARREVTA